MKTAKVDLILSQVVKWAENRADIIGVALVGSWAREAARADSDIDLMFLSTNATGYRDNKAWMQSIHWEGMGCQLRDWKDQDYGLVWSRHVYLDDGTEIEFSFSSPHWASSEPVEQGTLRVVQDGCKVLSDPASLFANLIAKIRLIQDK